MSHGAMIAIRAAGIETARTKLVDMFRLRGATAPDRALSLDQLGLSPSDETLTAMIGSGVIRGVDARGRPAVIGYEENRVAAYYLDESAYIAERDRRKRSETRALLVVFALVLAVILVLPLLFLVVVQRPS